ncbi:MAG: hypothetical protein QOG04_545 [Actinomycetota bacterium]|nr:hypothetical protein [Actinomycetota bacterium]
MLDFLPSWAFIFIGATLVGVVLGLMISDKLRKRGPEDKD